MRLEVTRIVERQGVPDALGARRVRPEYRWRRELTGALIDRDAHSITDVGADSESTTGDGPAVGLHHWLNPVRIVGEHRSRVDAQRRHVQIVGPEPQQLPLIVLVVTELSVSRPVELSAGEGVDHPGVVCEQPHPAVQPQSAGHRTPRRVGQRHPVLDIVLFEHSRRAEAHQISLIRVRLERLPGHQNPPQTTTAPRSRSR